MDNSPATVATPQPLLLVAASDGQTLTNRQHMTVEQFKEAEQQAAQHTVDNWYWVILNATQIHTNHFYVVGNDGARVGLIWYCVGTNHWVTQHQWSPHETRQHTFDHMAEAIMFCLEHPDYGSGTLTTGDHINDLIGYIRTLKIKETLFPNLEHLAQHQSIEVDDDINTLGQLAYAVWLDSSSHNNVPNCDHNPSWETMSQEEQNQWMRIGEMLFEQGRRWVLETVVKELYAVTSQSQAN